MDLRLSAYDHSGVIRDIFMSWGFSIISHFKALKPCPENLLPVPKRLKFSSSIKPLKLAWTDELNKVNPSFIHAIWKVFGKDFIYNLLPGIFGFNLGLIQALLVIYLYQFMADPKISIWKGAAYLFGYSASAIFSYYSLNLSIYKVSVLISNIKAVIPCVLYEKILDLPSQSILEGNSKGKFVNLIASEIEILDGMNMMMYLFSIPTFVIGGGLILWFTLGIAGIIGLLLSILHFPLIYFLGKIMRKLRIKIAANTDIRIKMITNLIEGIKIVKLYGWESPYFTSICEQRMNEIKEARKKATVMSIVRMIYGGGNGLILLVTFSVYVIRGNTLTPGTVFASVTVLLMIQNLISSIGANAVYMLFMFYAYMKRVTQMLLIKPKEAEDYNETKEYSIVLDNVSFVLENHKYQNAIPKKESTVTPFMTMTPVERALLNGINFSLKKGEKLAVLGSVGSGKSFLLYGILNEISLLSGELLINGKCTYTSGDPWVISGTVKDNILMGLNFDSEFYNKVVHACALKKDFELFKYGDETQVGDAGATLSGGQKARLCLARAVYANRDIILLDDPLSAVDSEVSAHIVEHCIRGLLKEKTVIIATHQLQILSKVDKIVILNSGEQLFYGSYQELTKREDLRKFVVPINETKEKNKKDIDEILKEIKDFDNNAQIQFEKEDQEKIVDSISLKIYYRFIRLGFNNIFAFILLIILLVIPQIIYIAVLWWLASWAKQSENEQKDSYYFEIFILLVIVLYITYFIRSLALSYGILNASKLAHNNALQGIIKSFASFFDINPTGRMINRFSKDTMVTDELLQMYFIDLVTYFIVILGNLIVVSIIAPPIIGAVCIFIIYVFMLIKWIVPITKDLKKIELISKSPIFSLVNSTINGLVTIRALDLKQKFRNDYKKAMKFNLRATFSYQIILKFYQGYTELGATIITILNVLVLMLYKDHISENIAAMVISLTTSMTGWVAYWSKTIVETDNFMASPQRLIEYAEIDPELESKNIKQFIIKKGKLKFKNLCMRYKENYPLALNNLTFTVFPGQKVGIIGRTGAGKSSILGALFRLYNPSSGTIFIDSQDYLEASLHDLRTQISVIPQSPTIFYASIRDNIDPEQRFSDKEIIDILKECKLQSLLASSFDGINTILSEGGNISSGQKQLICLARAILRQNKIVMMDEATANVDSETDKFIQKNIMKKFKDSTVLIVAHRLRTVIKTDMIIVMDEGSCKEQGSPLALAKNENSLLAKLIHCSGEQESQYLMKKIDKQTIN